MRFCCAPGQRGGVGAFEDSRGDAKARRYRRLSFPADLASREALCRGGEWNPGHEAVSDDSGVQKLSEVYPRRLVAKCYRNGAMGGSIPARIGSVCWHGGGDEAIHEDATSL